MRISEDSTVGANQKHEALWKRVKSKYDEARQANPLVIRSRKVSMLDGRFRRISTSVMKWVGFYEQARRRNGSGQNEENIISEAHKLHTPGKFTLEHAWIMLKGYQKWKTIIAPYVTCENFKRSTQQTFDINESPRDSVGSGSGSGKRVRLNSGDYSTPISIDDESTTTIRPEGSKAAKRNKGKGKANATSHIDVEKRVQEFLGTTERELAVEMEKLEFNKQKEARKQRKQDWDMLQSLRKEPSLPPELEEYKQTLLESFKKK